MSALDPRDQNLRQADLSHLRVADMTAAQKAELHRRYLDFVRHHAKAGPAAPAVPRKAATKWVPGRKAR